MFSLCEGHISYDSIPLHRKRWFVLSLFLGELWLLLLLYYLPLGLHVHILENRFVRIAVFCVFWAFMFGILCTGDVYAYRKNGVYKIKAKFLFIFLCYAILAGAIAFIAGAVFAVSRLAPENIQRVFRTIGIWAVQLLAGSKVTLWLTILAVSAGLVLSLFLALGKMSKKPRGLTGSVPRMFSFSGVRRSSCSFTLSTTGCLKSSSLVDD